MQTEGTHSPAFSAFEAPDTLPALIAAHERDPHGSVLIAGGQSLLPALLARELPSRRLIDIARVPELQRLELDGPRLILGAGVSFTALLAAGIGAHLPPLAKALGYVGNVTIRNRATVGGSLAWADPRAELPLMLLFHDAAVHTSRRRIAMADFLHGPNRTALQPGEIILHVEVERPAATGHAAFAELMPRQSTGKAIVAIAVKHTGAGVRLAVAGLADRAITSPALPQNDMSQWLDAVPAQYPVLADPVYPLAYRKTVAATLARRALEEVSA